MGWLVIAAHLPHHGLTILHVVPKRIVAPGSDIGCGVDADGVVVGAHHHLFAPVAKEVALIAGRSLGVVVGLRAGECLDEALAIFIDATGGVLAVGIVEALFEQVAVPIDAHVVGQTRLGESCNVVIGDAADGVVVRRETHGSGDVVGEVACHAASVIAAACLAIVDLAGGGVAIVVGRLVFVAGIDFMSVHIGVEVAVVLGIAVTESRGGESVSVVVDDHGTEANLIATVPVHIGHGIVMVAVAIPGT